MSGVASAAAPAGWDRQAAARAALLCSGLALALGLRIEVSQGDGTSVAGCVAFAAAALGLSAAAGWRFGVIAAAIANRRVVAMNVVAGIAGAAVLCAWPALARLAGGPHPALVRAPGAAFTAYAIGTLVGVAGEELLIRGALWQACTRALGGGAGQWLAVGTGAVAFALIHLPWYGAGILPLDLAVGLWLGALRLSTGSLTAPMTCHTAADLATWWLL